MFQTHNATKTILILIFGLALGIACTITQVITGPGTLFKAPNKLDTSAQPDGKTTVDWFNIYFTNPELNETRGGVDTYLVAAIDNAHVSVDVAAYELNLWSIRDALIRAHKRGVPIRMVTETSHITPEIEQLIATDIPVVDDGRDSLMHNKFVIIDQLEVWTGSANLTLNGFYRHNNNLIRLRDPALVHAYQVEFNEMFVDDRFGATSPANTPKHQYMIDETTVEVYFAPEDNAALRLEELIRKAQSNLYFMAFSFTADNLADAVVNRFKAGIEVYGLMDESQVRSNTGGEYERFLEEGLDIRLDGNQDKMHHKVFIIDQNTVVTGSYNFSKSAETKNDENVLIIHNEEIAELYLAEFHKLFDRAKQ